MSKSLAVALLHYTAPPVVGGVEQVLGRHAGLLADAGHAVRIVAGRGAPPDSRVSFVAVPGVDTGDPEIVRLQAELAAGRVPAAFPRVVDELVGRLGAALAGVDVLIAHNVASVNRNLALTAALHDLAVRPGAPRTILWHHDLAWARPADRQTLHPGHPWDLLRTAWPGVTHVAISGPRRADLVGLMGLDPSAVPVIPNGVDLGALLGLAPRTMDLVRAADLLAFAPLLLLPARITPRKNIELALRVVASMRGAGRSAAGIVVTGPLDPHDPTAQAYLEGLVALRRHLGLEASAIFLVEALAEPADQALVHDLYRLADLLLLPSLDEGFGIPLLESGAHRLPIVCSDLPALRDLAGDAARYFDPGADPGEIAALVLARLDEDPLAGFASRIRTEFAWEAVYRRCIAPLLAEGRSPALRSGRRRPGREGIARSR
jgi:glycosyltransferase involved in cell wall biosynthesis